MENGSNQRKSIERPIRLLGTFSGLIFGGLGVVIWTISGRILQVYHDLTHPVTWREPTLGALSSPTTFAASIVLALAVIIAAWRLSLPRAARLNLCLALLIAALIVAGMYFYFSLITFVVDAV